MYRRSTRWLIVAAACVLILFPGTALAGVVGSYEPAQVQCDRDTNVISIKPVIAIGNSFHRQRVQYQLAIQSRETGRWVLNQWFQPIDHNADVWTQVYSMYGTSWQLTYMPQVQTPWYSNRFADGTYLVWTRYVWEAPLYSNIWYDAWSRRFTDATAPWTRTTDGYTNLGDWQPGNFCKI